MEARANRVAVGRVRGVCVLRVLCMTYVCMLYVMYVKYVCCM